MIVADPDGVDLTAFIRRGDALMWGQAAAEPTALTSALMRQRHAIGGIEAFIGATWSQAADPAFADCVRFRSYCGTAANRRLAKAGCLDILPCNYSQLGAMIRTGQLKVDVLMLQLAPADADGRYSLSLAHEYLIPAIDAARVVLAEVNDQAPWTFGERSLGAADLDLVVHTSRAPAAPPATPATDIERAVAVRASLLIEDGATLQFGLGGIPEAILSQLGDRRDLGVHSGALLDAAARLAQAGVITHARKSIDSGVTVAGVAMGGRTLSDYVHRNAGVSFRSVDYTHSAQTMAGIDRLVAINSAVEVDLTGQINAEVAAGIYVGAVGGAGDFLRGAQRSNGGIPIVALPSTAGLGDERVSRIVQTLKGPVSTARCDAGFFVTEHGIADLRGLPLSKRIPRMLAIADPQFRDSLERAVQGR